MLGARAVPKATAAEARIKRIRTVQGSGRNPDHVWGNLRIPKNSRAAARAKMKLYSSAGVCHPVVHIGFSTEGLETVYRKVATDSKCASCSALTLFAVACDDTRWRTFRLKADCSTRTTTCPIRSLQASLLIARTNRLRRASFHSMRYSAVTYRTIIVIFEQFLHRFDKLRPLLWP